MEGGRMAQQVIKALRGKIPGLSMRIPKYRRYRGHTQKYRYNLIKRRIQKLKRFKKKVHFLPAAPKRAQTGYNIFVKEFIARTKRQENLRKGEGVRRASRAWNEMGPVERAPYYEKANEKAPAQNKAKKLWKAQKKALAKNGSPYSYFLKDYWKENYDGKSTLIQMSRRASERWKAMPFCLKRDYYLKSREVRSTFIQRIKNLAFGVTKLADFVPPNIPDYEEKKKKPQVAPMPAQNQNNEPQSN